jgi:hypothetical protein
MACCILAVTFACTFSVIFPLIGPPIALLVFLTLIGTTLTSSFAPNLTRCFSPPLPHWLRVRPDALADRWSATDLASETLRIAPCIATHPSRPDFFSRRLWPEGGTLVGTGGLTIFFVEVYTHIKGRLPGRAALSPVSQHALESFRKAAQPSNPAVLEEESTSIVSSGRARTRGSFASVLEMMSTTLAVVPSRYQQHGPVPLRTSSPSHFCLCVLIHVSICSLFSYRNAR